MQYGDILFFRKRVDVKKKLNRIRRTSGCGVNFIFSCKKEGVLL